MRGEEITKVRRQEEGRKRCEKIGHERRMEGRGADLQNVANHAIRVSVKFSGLG